MVTEHISPGLETSSLSYGFHQRSNGGGGTNIMLCLGILFEILRGPNGKIC